MLRFVFLTTLLSATIWGEAIKEIPQTVEVPFGLPPIPWPENNSYSKEKAELGRLLYFDKRLSADGTVSCASCHNATCGFSDCRPIAVGINDRKGTRRSQSIINAAYSKIFFWDGRAASLEEQCKGPVANTNEMSAVKNVHEAHEQCAERIKNIPEYLPMFTKVFGHENVTMDEIAQAIATFERIVLSGNSAYDRYKAGDRTAMTDQQIRGMIVFRESKCDNCHEDISFSSNRFMNIGIGMDAPHPDLGRYLITHNERDWGAFKPPVLRDVENKAPYMHDGSLKTLEEVVDYYDKGGIKNKNLHTLMVPLHLSETDKTALVSFLKALNGEGWQQWQTN